MNRRYVADSIFIAIILTFLVGMVVRADKKPSRPEATTSSPQEMIQQIAVQFIMKTVPKNDNADVIYIGRAAELSDCWRFYGSKKDFSKRIDGTIGEKAWFPVGKQGIAIPIKFKSRGVSGAMTTKDIVLFVGRDCIVLDAVDRENFSPHKPTGESPEQIASFIEQYGGGASFGSVE